MKTLALAGALACALGASGLAGCNIPAPGSGNNVVGPFVTAAAGDIAKVISNSSNACADLSALGASPAAVAKQIAAANPNSTQIQNAAALVVNGGAASVTQCQELAAAFTAEAPESQKQAKVKIGAKVWARLREGSGDKTHYIPID